MTGLHHRNRGDRAPNLRGIGSEVLSTNSPSRCSSAFTAARSIRNRPFLVVRINRFSPRLADRRPWRLALGARERVRASDRVSPLEIAVWLRRRRAAAEDRAESNPGRRRRQSR